jgi:nucleoside-diphosphate-sugar epimerase
MKYFVTGATSALGRAVTRRLVDAGHDVVTVARKPEQAREELDRGVEVVYGDVVWKKSLAEAFVGVNGVFHMGSYNHYKTKDRGQKRPLDIRFNKNIKVAMKEAVAELKEARAEASKSGMTVAERINIEGTRNVLEMVKELKIPKAVFTSTMAVYSDTNSRMMYENSRYRGPWNSEYEQTMWQAQFQVAVPMMEKGLPLVVLQPGLIYGPGDGGYVHELLSNYLRRGLTTPQDQKLRSYPKKTTYCWSHVDDVADAHIAAMQRGAIGENYLLTGPAHSIAHVLEQVQKITGIPLPKRQLSPFTLKMEAGFMRILGAMYAVPENYSYEALISIAGTTSLGSNEKAKAELGFRPRSLLDGLRHTLYYEMTQLGMIARDKSDDEVKILDLEPELS